MTFVVSQRVVARPGSVPSVVLVPRGVMTASAELGQEQLERIARARFGHDAWIVEDERNVSDEYLDRAFERGRS